MLSAATGVVQADARVSSQPAWCVESGHEFAVGGAGGGEVFAAFVELLSKVSVVLFELADALTRAPSLSAARIDRVVTSRSRWVHGPVARAS